MDALLDASVKSFVMASGQLKDAENAAIFLSALPKIFETIDANDFPFVAKCFGMVGSKCGEQSRWPARVARKRKDVTMTQKSKSHQTNISDSKN